MAAGSAALAAWVASEAERAAAKGPAGAKGEEGEADDGPRHRTTRHHQVVPDRIVVSRRHRRHLPDHPSRRVRGDRRPVGIREVHPHAHLGCLDVPTTGNYLLAGQDVGTLAEDSLADIRNRRIGFVFQQFNLLASMSAWRNVELPLAYAGVPRFARRERAITALSSVGLGSRVEHRPTELSGGQQQRVAMARALVTEPSLILADEPTGNLDSESSSEILRLLTDLHRTGRTIVLITHDPDVAQAAERVVRLLDGRVAGGSPPATPGSVATLAGNGA